MLNALESQRPNPRARPPHMTGAGLYSRPTVVNNVETFAAVPSIVRNGADWWKGLSVSGEGGTKIYGVAGRVARPGCVELPMGTSMRELIEVHAGGMQPGYELRAVSPGGASTAFVTRRGHRRRHGLRRDGEGRQPPGHGHARRAGRQDVPGRHDPQPAAVLRPGIVRLVHAVPRGSAVVGLAAPRHRGGPRTRSTTSTCSTSTSGSWAPTRRSATSPRERCSRSRRRCGCSATSSCDTSRKAAAPTRRRAADATPEEAAAP